MLVKTLERKLNIRIQCRIATKTTSSVHGRIPPPLNLTLKWEVQNLCLAMEKISNKKILAKGGIGEHPLTLLLFVNVRIQGAYRKILD